MFITTVMVPLEGHKFALGEVVLTQGVHQLVLQGLVNPAELLRRHGLGDWGDLCDSDKRLNDSALRPGDEGRVHSSYEMDGVSTVWVITEWDRSVTTLLLPSEH